MVWRTSFAITLLLCFLLAVAPWSYRNFSRFGSVNLSTVQGVTLLEWQVAEYLSAKEGVPFESVQKRLQVEARPLGYDPQGNPFKNAAVEQQLAMQYIWRDPGGFAVATIEGMAFMFVNVGSTALLERLAPVAGAPFSEARIDQLPVSELDRTSITAGKIAVAAVILPIFVIQWALFGLGARLLWRDRERFLLGMALVSIAYFTLTTGANGLIRFRMPMQPLFLLVAAVGAGGLLGQRVVPSSIAQGHLERVAQR